MYYSNILYNNAAYLDESKFKIFHYYIITIY